MTAFVNGLMTWPAAPPAVRDQITSKIWNVTMNSTAIATVNAGRSIGNVTARNTWAGRAHPRVGIGQAQEKRGNRGVIDEEHEEQTDRQDGQVGSPLLASNPQQAYCLYCAFSSFQRFATASTAASAVSWPWAALRIASVTLWVHGPHHFTVRGS